MRRGRTRKFSSEVNDLECGPVLKKRGFNRHATYYRNVIRAQACVRGYLRRRINRRVKALGDMFCQLEIQEDLGLELEMKHRAAIKIQAIMRGFMRRKREQRKSLLRQRFQYLSECEDRRLLSVQNSCAAVKIQAVVRSFLVRRTRDATTVKNLAATRIQISVRARQRRLKFGRPECPGLTFGHQGCNCARLCRHADTCTESRCCFIHSCNHPYKSSTMRTDRDEVLCTSAKRHWRFAYLQAAEEEGLVEVPEQFRMNKLACCTGVDYPVPCMLCGENRGSVLGHMRAVCVGGTVYDGMMPTCSVCEEAIGDREITDAVSDSLDRNDGAFHRIFGDTDPWVGLYNCWRKHEMVMSRMKRRFGANVSGSISARQWSSLFWQMKVDQVGPYKA